jgi:hypothetical protein
VRVVTVRASLVFSDLRLRKDVRVFVAGDAADCGFRFEFVGPVATDAVWVTVLEKSGLCNEGPLVLVTLAAGFDGRAGRRV